jgi:uncharacterized membrane protein HdeD (DUF308 family)
MKELLKNLGILLVLVGVIILIIHNFSSQQENSYLWAALSCMVIGLIGHVILNKHIN